VLLELFLRIELLAAVTALERFHLLLLVGYFVLGKGPRIRSSAFLIWL
jgi:hypothetical protein